MRRTTDILLSASPCIGTLRAPRASTAPTASFQSVVFPIPASPFSVKAEACTPISWMKVSITLISASPPSTPRSVSAVSRSALCEAIPLKGRLSVSHPPCLHYFEVVELGRPIHELRQATKELLRLWVVGGFHCGFVRFELHETKVIAGPVLVRGYCPPSGFGPSWPCAICSRNSLPRRRPPRYEKSGTR